MAVTIRDILASSGLTRIPILYSNIKKHEFYRTKLKPVLLLFPEISIYGVPSSDSEKYPEREI